jgi:hypothetical protein
MYFAAVRVRSHADFGFGDLAAAAGFTYSRYADDLVFSHPAADAAVGPLLRAVRTILTDSGFTVNEEKTAVERPHHRQTVTGLVVNAGVAGADAAATAPRLSRHDLRRFRAFLHQCEMRGVEAMTQQIGKDARAYAAGYLSFIHMVDADKAAAISAAHPWLRR